MTRSRQGLLLISACLLLLATTAATAQNRPSCLPAPTGPGACFIDGSVFPSITLLGADADGDFVQVTIPASSDDVFKFLPNGAVSAHLTDTEATFVVCPATAPPTCSTDGSGALTGSGRIQVNSFLAAGGVTSCPGTINASAELTDGTTDFNLTYSVVTVPNPSGCRTIVDDAEISLAP